MEGDMCWGSENDQKWTKVVNASIDYLGHFWMKIRPSGVLLLNRDGGQKWQKRQKGVTPKIPPFFTFFEILKRAYRRIRDWDHRMSGWSKSGSKSAILGPPKSENRPFCIIFDPLGVSKWHISASWLIFVLLLNRDSGQNDQKMPKRVILTPQGVKKVLKRAKKGSKGLKWHFWALWCQMGSLAQKVLRLGGLKWHHPGHQMTQNPKNAKNDVFSTFLYKKG